MTADHTVAGRAWSWQRIRSALSGPGVLFSLIWQVFLVYPVMAVLAADASAVWTVLGLVSVVAFSASYLVAFASPAATQGFPLDPREWRGGRDADSAHSREDCEPRSSFGTQRLRIRRLGIQQPPGLGSLAVLVVCAFGTAPAAGAHSVVTFLPFVACFATAVWPLRWSVPSALALIAAGVVTAFVVGENALLIPALLVIPVAMSMIGTRVSVGVSEREGHLRRALGAADERERVGRDLHDVLGHTLTALTIRAQVADTLVDADPEAAHRELRTIEQLTRTALSEMRQTVSGTRSADPERELAGFVESLRSAGTDVEVRGEPGLVPERHAALVAWTIREAGTNIVRHSGADRVTIGFDSSCLRIADDGVGIDTSGGVEPSGDVDGSSGGGRRGQGLAGLERRARDSGASFTVAPGADSRQGAGTVVEVRWA